MIICVNVFKICSGYEYANNLIKKYIIMHDNIIKGGKNISSNYDLF